MTVDNSVTLTEGSSGVEIATDFVVSGSTQAHYQYVKVVWGEDGVAYPVNTAGTSGPLPIQIFSNGTRVDQTGSALDVHLNSSGITLNTSLNALGITAMHVDGITTATIPVMVSGTTAIGGAINATIIGGTIDSMMVISGGTIDKISSATISGGTIDTVRSATVSGGTIDTVRSATVSGGTIDVISSATISGGTIDVVSSATVVGGTLDNVTVAGGTLGNVTIVGGTIDNISLGLTMGLVGRTLDPITGTDSAVVQGVSGGFPVASLVHGSSPGNPLGSTPIAASGDALKVSVVGAAISATISDTNISIAGGTVDLSGGTVDTVRSAGVTNTDAEALFIQPKTGASFTVSGSVGLTGSQTVTATDLDIRGLTFGRTGYTGDMLSLNTPDSIIVQGISGAFPVANVLYGFTTGAGGGPIALEVDFLNNTPTLKTVIDGRGTTNATALQIQGRNDGSTLFPVAIVGTGKTSGVSPIDGLVGVTFDIGTGLPVIGGATTPEGSSFASVATLIHGVSGTSIFPIGFTGSGDDSALNVNMVNADGISFSISVQDNLAVGNTLGNPVPVQGACLADNSTMFGLFVSGTAGSTTPHPVMIEGFSGGRAIEVTGSAFTDIISGATGSINNIYHGITGLCAAVSTLANRIGTPTNTIVSALGLIGDESGDNFETSLGANGYLKKVRDAIQKVIPDNAASSFSVPVTVNAPTQFVTERLVLTSAGVAPFLNGTSLKSGVRVKLHPGSTDVVFVGATSNTTTSSYFPLAPGDDVFIEIDSVGDISAICPSYNSSTSSNVEVFALGF